MYKIINRRTHEALRVYDYTLRFKTREDGLKFLRQWNLRNKYFAVSKGF